MTQPARYKIMYLSPTGAGLPRAQIFADLAARIKLPQTEVHVATLPRDEYRFNHLEFRSYEGLATRGILRATRRAAQEEFDALVIGCFYDTALLDAREISGRMHVTAPCVASCEIAASLANRFGVIGGRRKWVNQMHETIEAHGYGRRLSGFYPVDLGVNDFQADHAETRRRLIEAGRRAIQQDGAEALILGCTLETGFYREVEEQLGVPVMDPSIAALKRAEYAAILKHQCGWTPSRKWSCEAPDEAELARFGVFDSDDAFGVRLVVAAATAAPTLKVA